MNYTEIRKNEKSFKALTSYTVTEFDSLLPYFETELNRYLENYTLNGKKRTRRYTPKAEKQLPTVADKLFFVLYYLKNNPTQESLAFAFDVPQDMCNKWIHILCPLLSKALKTYQAEENYKKACHKAEEHETVIIDATEREVQRDKYEQEQYYSGKKKRHTIKNILIISMLGLVLFCSRTEAGRIHDKTLAHQIQTDKTVKVVCDLGFYGWNNANITVLLPHKKPKGKALDETQKAENRIFNAQRVKIEQVIGKIKVLRILKDTIRNYKKDFKHLVMKTGVQLYNFKLVNSLSFCS